MADPRSMGAGHVQDLARMSGGTSVLLNNGDTITVDTSGVTIATDSSVTLTVAGGVLTVIADPE